MRGRRAGIGRGDRAGASGPAGARQLLWLVVVLGCVTLPSSNGPRFCDADPKAVLAAAEEVLARQGFVFEENTLGDGLLIAQQSETVTRVRGSFIKGTMVRTQVVVEAIPDRTGTDVLATFNVSLQRPTGERRTWSPETPQCRALREDFYADLEAELGVALSELPLEARRSPPTLAPDPTPEAR